MKFFIGVYLTLYAVSFNNFLISEFSVVLVYLKYIGSIILAAVSVIRFRVRPGSSLNVLLFLFFGLFLMYVQLDLFWAFQFLLVLFVVNAFIQREYISVAIYIIPILIFSSIVLDVFFNGSAFIFNAYYGRPRMLLGFNHPKEIASLLFILAVSLHLVLTSRLVKGVWFVTFLIAFYLIGSRGMLVAYITFHIVYSLSSISIFVLFPLGVALTVLLVDNLNLISSGRLHIWAEAFEGKDIFKFKGSSNSLASVDNYFVNVIVDLGLGGFLFLVFFLCLYFILNSNSFVTKRSERLAAFFALLSIGSVDSVLINITVPVSLFLLVLMVSNRVDKTT